MAAALLEAQSVRKSFQGVHALRSASFELRAGEIHALVGENGAGKSTLVNVITGAVRPDDGVVRIQGEEVTHFDPHTARDLGVAAVYQQPALFPDLTVAENIALSLERGPSWQMISWRKRRLRAQELLSGIGAQTSPDTLAGSLSMPEQQLVEIAKAIGSGARIVIFDEPTASLAALEVERLFQVIRRMRAEGVGIIYISHRLDEVASLADRITVMRDGEAIQTCNAAGITRDELIELMIGRKLSPTSVSPCERGSVALELRGVCQHARGLRNISFTVHSGEIVGIAGLAGAGRTELAETIFGLTPADAGEIRIRDVRARIGDPTQAIAQGIAYVPEDRRQHGVVLPMPIFANITLARLKGVSRFGLMQMAQEQDVALDFMRDLQVKAPSSQTMVGTLSGGNQQKVALSRWLATQPRVLLLDEPTQGVDVGAKTEIHSIIRKLAEQGMAVVMISSEMEEVLGLSDRILVLAAGRVRGILPRGEATQSRILSLAMDTAAA